MLTLLPIKLPAEVDDPISDSFTRQRNRISSFSSSGGLSDRSSICLSDAGSLESSLDSSPTRLDTFDLSSSKESSGYLTKSLGGSSSDCISSRRRSRDRSLNAHIQKQGNRLSPFHQGGATGSKKSFEIDISQQESPKSQGASDEDNLTLGGMGHSQTSIAMKPTIMRSISSPFLKQKRKKSGGNKDTASSYRNSAMLNVPLNSEKRHPTSPSSLLANSRLYSSLRSNTNPVKQVTHTRSFREAASKDFGPDATSDYDSGLSYKVPSDHDSMNESFNGMRGGRSRDSLVQRTRHGAISVSPGGKVAAEFPLQRSFDDTLQSGNVSRGFELRGTLSDGNLIERSDDGDRFTLGTPPAMSCLKKLNDTEESFSHTSSEG